MPPPDAQPAFGYAYGGGRPPSSSEVLLVRRDGLAQYVAGHTWPKQPPYDEVGIYQMQLPAERRAALEKEIASARARRGEFEEGPRDADAGSELVEASSEQGAWRETWGAAEVPGPFAPLVAAARDLISELRRHPLSTLHVAFEPGAWGPAGTVGFRLSNRGQLPFTFYGFGHEEPEQRAEVRLKYRDEEELQLSPTASPIELLRQEPVRVDDANGETRIEPGGSRVVTVSQPLSELRPSQPGALFALFHVVWDDTVSMRPAPRRAGWLMPRPLTSELG